MGFQALRNFKYKVIDNQPMTADITSDHVNIQLSQAVALQFSWSGGGTPIGSMIVQVSIDGVNFVDLSSQALSGNSGSFIFNIEEPGYSYVKAKYAFTSGNANLTVIVSGKAF